jgi:hypothetical protein
MNKLDLSLNYAEIYERVNAEKLNYKSGKTGEWAEFIKVSTNVVSNIHGKSGSKQPRLLS